MKSKLTNWQLLGLLWLMIILLFLTSCSGGKTTNEIKSSTPSQATEQAKGTDKPAGEQAKPTDQTAGAQKEAQTQSPTQLKKINLAIPSTGLSHSVFTMINKKGFFQKEGLQFETIQMPSSSAMPALVNGDVDFAQHSGSAARAAVKGMPIKILFYFGGKPHHVLLASPKINSIQDLKGSVVGIAGKGDTTELTTKLLLEKAGMNIKDVTLLAVGSSSQMLAALTGGSVSATMISGETGLIASKKQGFKVLAHASEVVEAPITGVVATDKKITDDLETVKAVLRGHAKGINYVTNPANKQEIITMLLSDTGLKLENDRELAEKLYELIAAVFTKNGLVSDKAIQAEMEQIKADTEMPDIKIDTIYNFSILKQIVQELGI